VKTDTDSSGAVTYQLSQPPAGMAINSDTGLITWTPTADQTPTEQVTVQATDPAGNTSQQQFTINVLATNIAPVLTAANPSLGTTNEDTAITISLAQFINGSGTTTITDADQGAVIGGLALTGVTGNGTWQYSLDGTTFTDVGTVSESSAACCWPATPNCATSRTARTVKRPPLPTAPGIRQAVPMACQTT